MTDVTAVRRRGWGLALVSAAQFVLQLDYSIVNVALPTIERKLSFAPAELQWIVTGYAMTFGALLLLGGRIADRVGRRRVLIAGLVLFGATSLSAGLAQESLWLVASRVAQGASAALVAPAALATVSDLYPDGAGRTRALGIFQGATAAGASAGIVLGGVLTEYAGWRSIFLVNPAVIVVLVAALWWLVPAGGRDRSVSLDLPGALVVTVSIGALIYGLSQGQQHGFTGAAAITPFAIAVALGAVFIGIETRSRSPMVPLNMLADRARRTALVVMLFVGAAIGCYVYFTSLYLQRVLGFSPLLTGVSMLPSTVTVLLISMLVTPRLIGRFSVTRLLFAGLVLMGAGLTWLSRMSATGTYQADVLGGLLLIALGMGVVIPAASVSVAAGMSSDERGLASALFATAQQVGQAVGLAVLATIAAARTESAHGSLVSGYRLSYLVTLAGVVVLAFMLLRPARLLRPLTEERKL